MVLVFAAESVGNPDCSVLAKIAADHNRFLDEQTRCWPLCNIARKEQLELGRKQTCPFLCWSMRTDYYIGPRSLRRTPVNRHCIYITDRFGEVFAVYRGKRETMPSAQEIIKWLTFINIQCPECGHPECPA